MRSTHRAGALLAGCRALIVVPAAAVLAAPLHAQRDSTRRDTTTLAAVTVIGSRSDIDETHQRLLDVPGGIAMITPGQLRTTRQANLSDVLKLTPGVYVQSRFGAADESQISVRGSGLRNNFHARGVNLLVNGMPYRNADGFTDFESLELLTTEAIEVYKGANALRYGGSTLGGAVNLFTQTGYTAPSLTAFLQGGAHGFGKGQLATGGRRGSTDWYASAAHTQLDGYRDWSDQRRDRVNLHAGRVLGRSDFRAFYFFAHVQEHLPGSLTRAEFDANPSAASAANVANQWGRDYDLHHAGVQLRAQITPTQRIEISPYLQYRDIDHPIFEVINQLSHDWGVEARYENAAVIAGRENNLVVGIQPAYGTMINTQFVNNQGRHGAPTRDEHDYATTAAAYLENRLTLTPGLRLSAGFRAERSTRKVDDFFQSNGDQSDRRTYDAFTPRLGLTFQARPSVQLFANASRTVEPPLLLELSSFGNAGGFINLRPQSAWQYEAGARRTAGPVSLELSIYDIELRDELLNRNVQPFPAAPFTVPTYRNVPKTRHAGIEAGVAARRDGLSGRLAYTYSHFTIVSDPTFTGNTLPGAPPHYISADATYSHRSGFSLTPSLEWVPQSYVINSANTVSNDAWSNVGLRADWTVARLGTTVFVYGQNLANARYSASVQVDNAAGRWFEPADPRSVYAGVRVTR
jgi:iron complex outermembrane recepter protein